MPRFFLQFFTMLKNKKFNPSCALQYFTKLKNKKWNPSYTFSIIAVLIFLYFFPSFNEIKAYYMTATDAIDLPDGDGKLIAFTQRFLVPPSKLPYNLSYDLFDYSQNSISPTVMDLLQNKTNGFFVECGALTGESISNTLMMERHFNWTGLLVEGAPNNVEILMQKQRKAWIAPGCMSVNNTAQVVSFVDNGVWGRVMNEKNLTGYTAVLCIPFNTMMAALGRKHVDYFSLDVEGSEFDILKTIDFERIQIDVMSVEHEHNTELHEQIIQHMEANNFKMHLKGAWDFYFVNKRLTHLM